MTNKDKTGTARQQARRQREKEWLTAHGYKSWEALHTELMNGTVALDKVTPLYSRPSIIDNALLEPAIHQAYQELLNPKKKGKKS